MTLLRPKGLRRAGAGNIEVDLSGGPTAVTLDEEDIISLVTIERRVKMNNINRFVFDIAAEYFINTDWHGQKHGLTQTETRTDTDRDTDRH
ncbi:MAG: hypothetical protein NTX52_01260 [Planctomycetota bacterium]|nr:hypothetical protein [Planctomycetota bacterium]